MEIILLENHSVTNKNGKTENFFSELRGILIKLSSAMNP